MHRSVHPYELRRSYPNGSKIVVREDVEFSGCTSTLKTRKKSEVNVDTIFHTRVNVLAHEKCCCLAHNELHAPESLFDKQRKPGAAACIRGRAHC